MTPEQEGQVARALAALAGTQPSEPVPPDVVARLDGALADLVAERDPDLGTVPHRPAGRGAPPDAAGTGGRPGQDDLSRRRRSRVPRVLVAAAAVAVVASGGGAILRAALDDSAGDSASSADRSADAQAGAAAPGPAGRGGGPESAGSVRSPGLRGVALPTLRTDSLPADARRLLATAAVPGGPGKVVPSGGASGTAEQGQDSCARPSVRDGERRVAVLLDGRRATAVLPTAGADRIRVYTCRDAATPVATVRVR